MDATSRIEEPFLDLGKDGGTYTLSELQAEIKDSIRTDYPKFRQLARPEILRFFEHCARENMPEAKLIAERFHDVYTVAIMVDGSHNCYANDLFYVANKFDLGELNKRRSAIIVVWNGRHKYFEWITHMGFDNAKLFAEMGLVSRNEADEYRKMSQSPESDLYCFMNKHVEDRLMVNLRLTEPEIANACLLSRNIWEMEHGKYSSGQYSSLPWRSDLRTPSHRDYYNSRQPTWRY